MVQNSCLHKAKISNMNGPFSLNQNSQKYLCHNEIFSIQMVWEDIHTSELEGVDFGKVLWRSVNLPYMGCVMLFFRFRGKQMEFTE